MELQQFREVLVNVVIATDLFYKDIKALRESGWEKSVSSVKPKPESAWLPCEDSFNRRATTILELIIHASAVSHTMHHFEAYKKWNVRLLAEMYEAYRSGRSAKDPTEGWYEGELLCFDNCIIPLAQNLRECGVFGVSCDAFLINARDNRTEWETKKR